MLHSLTVFVIHIFICIMFLSSFCFSCNYFLLLLLLFLVVVVEQNGKTISFHTGKKMPNSLSMWCYLFCFCVVRGREWVYCTADCFIEAICVWICVSILRFFHMLFFFYLHLKQTDCRSIYCTCSRHASTRNCCRL